MTTVVLHKTTTRVRPYYKSLFDSPLVLMLSFGLGATALFIVGILEESLVATWFIASLLLGLGTLVLFTEGRLGHLELARKFWVTFGLRIFVTFITHLWLAKVYSEPFWQWGAGGGDELNFYTYSQHLAVAWRGGYIFTEESYLWGSDYSAWIYLIGFIRFLGMTLGGDTIFNIKLLSCFFSALLVSYVYKLGQHFFNRSTAQVSAAIAFWLPDFWYYGATLLRDVMVSFMVVFVMYQVVVGIRVRFNPWRLSVAVVLNFVVIHHLKVWLAEALTIIVFLWWVWEKVEHKAGRLLLLITLTILITLLIVPLLRHKVAEVVLYSGESIGLVQRLAVQNLTGIEEASADSIGGRIAAMPVFIRVPVNMVQLLLSIPPWASINKYGVIPRAIVESVAAFVWLGFVIFLPAGFLDCIRRDRPRRTAWIWGTALILIFNLALASTIIPRWRMMVMPFLLILVARGMSIPAYRWVVKWSAASIVGLLIVYLAFKYVL
ncbi:hypothetical protein H8E77_22505 [bacterium]|nr:hypothetical protein [bacterium]